MQTGGATYTLTNVTSNHTVQVTFSDTTLSISPSATSPQILTADGSTPLVFTITNNGTVTATNITATRPLGWNGVNIVASTGCANLAPNSNTCTFTLTSSTPNLAEQFSVQGSNTGTPLQSPYVAFRINGGLVFSVDGRIAKVVSEIDNNLSKPWYAGTNVDTFAQSPTDGYYNAPSGGQDTNGNTYKITNNYYYGKPSPATYAAAVCYNDVSSRGTNGDWYLPAICEMGYNDSSISSDAGCGDSTDPLIQNILSNLVDLGFLEQLKNNYYWSSSEYRINCTSGVGQAWIQSFRSSIQEPNCKNFNFAVRCARAFTY